MHIRKIASLILTTVLILSGCAAMKPVTYNQVERTNFVEITQLSGKKVTGTVLKSEPHQFVVLTKDRTKVNVSKTSIKNIVRKPPVTDDLGRGIAEEEIASVKTNRNAKIFGFGGGAISFGASFFLGSMISNSMDSNGGAVFAATTLVGGGVGTYLFVRGGQKADRAEAIEKIRAKRTSIKVKDRDSKVTDDELKMNLEQEKIESEKLRKEREKLLKQLKDNRDH